MTVVLLLVGSASVYWVKETTNAQLVETVKVSKQEDDFTLHIRVENHDEGFQILRSIQYDGDESVKIEHRTPLTAVSINQSGSDFTGSPVTKTLNPGDIYTPQEPLSYKSLGKGEYLLYVHSQFFVDGKQVNITCESEIVFQ